MNYSIIYDRYYVFKVSMFQSFKVSKFQDSKIPRYKDSRFQDSNIKPHSRVFRKWNLKATSSKWSRTILRSFRASLFSKFTIKWPPRPPPTDPKTAILLDVPGFSVGNMLFSAFLTFQTPTLWRSKTRTSVTPVHLRLQNLSLDVSSRDFPRMFPKGWADAGGAIGIGWVGGIPLVENQNKIQIFKVIPLK